MSVKDANPTRVIVAVGLALAALVGTCQPVAAAGESVANEPILSEIVVTANKRTENVQDVAASVSVQSGEQLVARGQTQLADYAAYIPGFDVANGGSPGQSAVELRGISTSANGSAVGTYLDDAPMGGSSAWLNASATLLDVLPYDLDRLEVLRGPQGTLYGAGSMGGLIKYVLKAPSTNEFQANVGADMITIDGAGRTGYSLRTRVNVPVISEVLGVSLSVSDKVMPGFMTNAYTGERDTNQDRQYAARLSVLWTPLSNLSVKVTAFTQEIEAGDLAVKQFANVTKVPTTDGSLVLAPAAPLPPLTESFGFIGPYDERINFFSSTVDWNPGPFDVVSATSWSSQRSYTGVDYTPALGSILQFLGGTGPGLANFGTFFGLDKFTEEFRLVSPQGRTIEWLVGLFDTHESSFDNQSIDAFNFNYQPTAPGNLFTYRVPEIFDERAAFGDLTWRLSDAFSVTGGARYAKNDQDFDVYQAPGPLVTVPGLLHVGTHEGVFTWMGTAEYRFDKDTMVYARAATGYRPGGPNVPIVGLPATFKADTLTNYELGLKSTFLDRKAQVDFAVYRIDWKNVQLVAVSNNLGYFANGGNAVSQGLELASKYSPIRGLTLGLNAAYTDAHLTSLSAAANYLITGYQLPDVPKESFSFTVDYNWALSSRWTASIGGAYRYVGKQWLAIVESASPASSPTVQAPSYSFLDLNASVRQEHLTYSVYARNVTNNLAITAPSAQGLVVTNSATGAAQINTSFLQPRTVGLGIDYRF